MIYRRGQSMRVMVYAGRDPLTGKKKWVSRQVRGAGRAALKEASRSRPSYSPRSLPAATRVQRIITPMPGWGSLGLAVQASGVSSDLPVAERPLPAVTNPRLRGPG